MVLLLAALRSFAQDPVPTQNPLDQAKPAGPPTVVLPAGTRIPLALQRAISTKTSKPGDMAYLLTTAPVIVGDRAVIPPDTFVQGQIAQITVPGIDRDCVLQIHSAHLVFSNGYTVGVPYDIVVRLDRQWIYAEPPGPGRALGLTAALSAPVAGALIGGLTSMHSPPPLTPPVPGQPLAAPNLGNPVKGAAIGGAIGLAVTIPVTVALLRHQRDFVVERGAPSEMILESPLVLEQDRIAAAPNLSPVSPSLALGRCDATDLPYMADTVVQPRAPRFCVTYPCP
jgi:hypothetical protein